MANILVIDDEDLFRESTAQALRRRGFDTIQAGSGRDGAELARRHLPDLVLCDVNMEHMNGYQTLETLRREPATASIPFILMTGMGDTEAMRKGMNMGADDYLPKPFTAPQLVNAIDARLKKRDLLRQSAEKKLADLRANLTLALPHEFVTPLNGIFGLAQLLASEAQALSPKEVAEFGRDILLCAERLQRTVQNFLLYGQLEIQVADPEARAALRAQRTDQCGCLIENRARRAATATNRGADLQLAVADGSVAMASDLFTRLVDELVGNAFKFSQPGQPVRVASSSGNGAYKLAIEDRGVGMTAEQIASVSAYTQFDRRRHEQQGAGLGLAIVQRLSQLHGGEFKIQSEPGKGTTVHVSLPGD